MSMHHIGRKAEVRLTRTEVQAGSAGSVAAAAMGGDRSAIQALWQEHRRWIAAVLLAYKPRSVELDDLLQEVAMTLVAKIDTLRQETNVRAWLRAVAINAARAAGRNERSRPMLYTDHVGIEVASSDQSSFSHSDHSERMMKIASHLPEAYREPLMLKAVHGMRSRQIAEILGIPEATVDTRISRARRMVREQARLQDRDMMVAADVKARTDEVSNESAT
jgi:RNA polymerase sigma-70 factor, ECF subfamily